MWCLGNEMDGPWQIGPHAPPTTTARSPPQTAKAMRQLDPIARARGLRLLQRAHADLRRRGSATVLAAHLRRRRLHLVPRLLRGARRRPRQLPRLGGRHGPLHRDGRRHRRPRQGRRRAATRRSTSPSTSGTSGTSNRSPGVDKITDREVADAPRLLEDVYSVADAVVVGNLLITLLKHADRVTAASPRPAGQRDRADHDRARRRRPGGRRPSSRSRSRAGSRPAR